MNILVDAPPVELIVGGVNHGINTDFKTCLKINLAFEDNELTMYEKQLILLNNLYEVIPDNIELAVKEAILFLDGGSIAPEVSIVDDQPAIKPRLYLLSKDANFIYSAFMQTHSIDLQKVNMHWWVFLALFMDLGPDTTFCNLIGLRSRLANGTATKEDRRAASAMGDMVYLEQLDTRTLDERELEDEFIKAVERAEAKRKEAQQ